MNRSRTLGAAAGAVITQAVLTGGTFWLTSRGCESDTSGGDVCPYYALHGAVWGSVVAIALIVPLAVLGCAVARGRQSRTRWVAALVAATISGPFGAATAALLLERAYTAPSDEASVAAAVVGWALTGFVVAGVILIIEGSGRKSP